MYWLLEILYLPSFSSFFHKEKKKRIVVATNTKSISKYFQLQTPPKPRPIDNENGFNRQCRGMMTVRVVNQLVFLSSDSFRRRGRSASVVVFAGMMMIFE